MTSLLDTLKARREELAAEQVIDVAVPLWTKPDLRLRIRPVDHGVISHTLHRITDAPKRQRASIELDANAALLAQAVVGVLVGDHPAVKLSDPDLLEGLGVPEGASAAEVVKAIVVREGDILALAAKVTEHSGYAGKEIDEATAGE